MKGNLHTLDCRNKIRLQRSAPKKAGMEAAYRQVYLEHLRPKVSRFQCIHLGLVSVSDSTAQVTHLLYGKVCKAGTRKMTACHAAGRLLSASLLNGIPQKRCPAYSV